MSWRAYVSISLSLHLLATATFIILWPRPGGVRPLEIILVTERVPPIEPRSGTSHDRSEVPQDVPATIIGSEFGSSASRVLPVPRLPMLEARPVTSDTGTEFMQVPVFDRGWEGDSGPRPLAAPVDSLLNSTARPTSSSSSAAVDVEWVEGGEPPDPGLNTTMFRSLNLKGTLQIEVTLEIDSSGLVRSARKTITGNLEVDQAVDRFLDQLSFRPSETDREVRLTIRLMPGAIYR